MSLVRVITKCHAHSTLSSLWTLAAKVDPNKGIRNFFLCYSKWFLSGAGYHIVLQKGPHCDVQKISAVIRSHVPNAAMENDNEDELSFILPRAYTTRYGSREF